MGIGYLLLVFFGAYVALKYYTVSVKVERKRESELIAPPGINVYCCQAQVNRAPQQGWAFETCNPCSTTEQGFAPSLGPNENQPNTVVNLEI